MMCGSGAAFWPGGWIMMFPMFLAPLGLLLGVVALLILAWALLRWLNSRPLALVSRTTVADLSPSEILRQRYARGEIDTATFDDMQRRIDGSRRLDDAAQLPGR